MHDVSGLRSDSVAYGLTGLVTVNVTGFYPIAFPISDNLKISDAKRISASETVCRLAKRGRDARLTRRVAGVGNDDELGLGPRAMQVPRARRRTHDVVTALHDDARDVADLSPFFLPLPLPPASPLHTALP